jgi:hypothetical protein
VVWERVLSLEFVRAAQMPSQSNLLSHVIAFENHGVAVFTGDAGFAKAPADSMTTGWEDVLRRADVVDAPHHGGQWGLFAARAADALCKGPNVLAVFLSIAPHAKNTPNRLCWEFLEAIARGRRLEVLAANEPNLYAGWSASGGVDGIGSIRTVVHIDSAGAQVCPASQCEPLHLSPP